MPLDLGLPAQTQLLQSEARAFLERAYSLEQARAVEASDLGYSPPLWQEIHRQGWLDLLDQRDADTVLSACALLEELGCARAITPYADVFAAGLLLARYGSQAAWNAFSSTTREQGRVVALAMGDESGVLNGDLPGVACSETAGQLRLEGAARFVPFVEAADGVLLAVKLDQDEPGFVLVPAAAQGLACRRMRAVSPVPLYDLGLEAVLVPTEALLARGHEPFRWLTDVLTVLRCAEMLGGCAQVFDQSLAYAKTRHQFGQPIGSFQGIQNRFANALIDLDVARVMLHDAAWRLGAGEDATDALLYLRSWAGPAFERICTEGHHINGAMSLTQEYGLEFLSRRAFDVRLSLGPTAGHHLSLMERLEQAASR